MQEQKAVQGHAEKQAQLRVVPLEGTFNFRDLGGYVGAGGKKVKWGTFYRADALHKLTTSDVETLVTMGIKTIVDFRGDGEWQNAPDVKIPGTVRLNLSPNAEVARLASGDVHSDQAKVDALLRVAESPEGPAYFAERQTHMEKQMERFVSGEYEVGQYRKFMRLLFNPENVPIIFHCRGGKDRTGWAAMLILFALGVSKADITADYMLTKTCMEARNVERLNEYRQYSENELVLNYLASLMDTRESYLAATFAAVEAIAGTPENYLREVMLLTDEELATLRDLYLED